MVFFVLTTWVIALVSCSTVYIQNDELGTSKYIVHGRSYKYVEKTENTNFRAWGTYRLTDSTIVFYLNDKKRIHYNYFGDEAIELTRNDDAELLSILVIDKHTKEPMPFAPIEVKNEFGKHVTVVSANFEGVAVLKRNNEIEILEVAYIGYEREIISYQSCQDSNLVIEIEESKSTKGLVPGCLVSAFNISLAYRIQSKSGFDEFRRNGVVFKRKTNKQK